MVVSYQMNVIAYKDFEIQFFWFSDSIARLKLELVNFMPTPIGINFDVFNNFFFLRIF